MEMKQQYINTKSAVQAANDVFAEYTRARKHHGPMRSPHEALGVIDEEWHELKLEIYARDFNPFKARKEAIQVAAMALAFIAEVCDPACDAERLVRKAEKAAEAEKANSPMSNGLVNAATQTKAPSDPLRSESSYGGAGDAPAAASGVNGDALGPIFAKYLRNPAAYASFIQKLRAGAAHQTEPGASKSLRDQAELDVMREQLAEHFHVSPDSIVFLGY